MSGNRGFAQRAAEVDKDVATAEKEGQEQAQRDLEREEKDRVAKESPEKLVKQVPKFNLLSCKYANGFFERFNLQFTDGYARLSDKELQAKIAMDETHWANLIENEIIVVHAKDVPVAPRTHAVKMSEVGK